MRFIILIAVVISNALSAKIVINDEPVYQNDNSNFLSGRIISGQLASENQFPWHVNIRMGTTITNPPTGICGGSLIHENYILTACHCVNGYKKFYIGLGSTILNKPLLTLESIIAIKHPYYNRNNLNNDIALIKIPTISPSLLSYKPNIIPIRLASMSSNSYAGEHSFVSGFGRTSQNSGQSADLRYTTLNIITNENCSRTYGTNVVVQSTICARGLTDSTQSICLGDSGGPLVYNNSGNWTQIGVASFTSSRGCASGSPSGYSRISEYVLWIYNVISSIN